MCGIFAVFHSSLPEDDIRLKALRMSKRLRHRGPDWSGLHLKKVLKHVKNPKDDKQSTRILINVLAHERLAIVDPGNGAQPLFSPDQSVVLAVNGEIYNHIALRNQLTSYPFTTGSDCETILALYNQAKKQSNIPNDQAPFDLNVLDGVFAFVMLDQEQDICFAARDPIGICSFYIGWAEDDSVWFASELKSLHEGCVRFQEFPPGHWWSSATNKFQRYYNPAWMQDQIPNRPLEPKKLHDALEKAVLKRLMCDVPYGVLLSGGLDSSLIASLVCKHAAKRVEDDERTEAWYPRVHSFSIGLKDSPDLKAASKVAAYLKTVHHECVFTVQQAIDSLRDVIYHIETYDVTTIRASTPMYLLSRLVRACGVKVLLSGEGADEAFAGYLYFHAAPNAKELHEECKRKIALLSRYDCLRANKSSAAFSVEVRVPFLDKDFLQEVMSLDPEEKMVREGDLARDGAFADRRKIEKFALRRAFSDAEPPYLPDEVLWRQKEQFSDGVGYGWIDSLRSLAEKQVSDEEMQKAANVYPHNTPTTKEAYMYRKWFQELFPESSAENVVPGGGSIACSTEAALRWKKEWANMADPSGRSVIGVHEKAISS